MELHNGVTHQPQNFSAVQTPPSTLINRHTTHELGEYKCLEIMEKEKHM